VAQALGWVDASMHSVVPPIWPSASYERSPDGSYPGGHSYTRDQNPTYDQAEALLARLEGGSEALLFASGMAAASTVLEALEPGAHVLAPRSMYWTLRLWLRGLSERGRLRVEFVPTGDLEALRASLRPGETRLVWVESPANPLCEITDIAGAAEIAHAAGALLVADSTLATPVSTRPLELGADLVMHSATKQLNGHADVVAGALITARCDDLWDAIRYERGYRGAILGPFEAWLLLRGMRTLYLRVERSSASALHVAQHLASHGRVRTVYYPGLPGHPRHELAARQMHGRFGPLVSFCVGGDETGARQVAARLRLFRDATSLGGVESLVEHRASVEGQGSLAPPDLLRLSIGIEDPDDLVSDLDAALNPA
jgi:cystathionine gamma-synthase